MAGLACVAMRFIKSKDHNALQVRLVEDSMGEQPIARVPEREHQRFTRNAFHVRSDHPCQAGGDVARKRYRLTLDIQAAIPFQEMPVGVETPHEAVAIVRRLRLFVALACMLDLLDFGAVGTARAAAIAYWTVVNVIVRIHDD